MEVGGRDTQSLPRDPPGEIQEGTETGDRRAADSWKPDGDKDTKRTGRWVFG